MPALRVLHLICPTGYYGAERWVLAQARHLDRHRIEVQIVATREGADPVPELLERAWALGLSAHELPLRGRFDPQAPRRLRELARGWGARILHSHGYKSDLLAVMARDGGSSRVLSTPHGFERALGWKMRLYEKAGNWALRRCDVIAPLSSELCEELRARGVDAGRIRLIENGVDLGEIEDELARESPPPASPAPLAYVGRLAPLKNLDGMLRAFAILHGRLPKARLRILGEGPEEDSLRRLALELGIDTAVDFLGYREDRLALLRECSLFTMCSRFEGIPRSMMEAMGLGLPAVAYEIPGTARLIEDQVTGWLVPMDDARGLAEAWEGLLRDPDRAREMGLNAHRIIRERFSAQRMAREYEELYEELVRGPLTH